MFDCRLDYLRELSHHLAYPLKFVEFVASVAGFFEQCFGLRSSKPNKHLRAVELERNFRECRSKTNPASKAWEDTLLYCTLVSQKVLLLTMCTCIYSSISGLLLDLFSSQENTSRPAAQEAVDNIMEIDAVKDHAGWAIKLAQDIINSSTKVEL